MRRWKQSRKAVNAVSDLALTSRTMNARTSLSAPFVFE
jgi:hypothetical protein